MILIGSRAIAEHFSDFRNTAIKDYDVVVTMDEYEGIKKKNNIIINERESDRVCEIAMVGKTKIEFHKINPGNESFSLLQKSKEKLIPYLGKVHVATPNDLISIKKSHIHIKNKWQKHIEDYHFLKSKGCSLNLELYQKRKEEHDNRWSRKVNLKMSNKDFFSQHKVKRIIPHDAIHEAVKFYDRPLFMELKEDQSSAYCEKSKFEELSYEDKVKTVQEESMVISLERLLIPFYLETGNKPTSKQVCKAYYEGLAKISTHLTSGWFREFALENYPKVKHAPMNFWNALESSPSFYQIQSSHQKPC